ncbi:hypothetical protein SLS58_009353 [Diplodia intermedia]|uniref:Uncharacterized protein n=1 Tax=Diplodia intermedia TaxID=856260 RepID=A0ABR3TD53_9PEZI
MVYGGRILAGEWQPGIPQHHREGPLAGYHQWPKKLAEEFDRRVMHKEEYWARRAWNIDEELQPPGGFNCFTVFGGRILAGEWPLERHEDIVKAQATALKAKKDVKKNTVESKLPHRRSRVLGWLRVVWCQKGSGGRASARDGGVKQCVSKFK